MKIDLSREEDWTPMMLLIHRKALVAGLICGFGIGIGVGIGIGYLIV